VKEAMGKEGRKTCIARINANEEEEWDNDEYDGDDK
jgi:hypothetical protein